MCGIFGYYNFRISRERREVLEILFTGLKRLEYRGYDSSGLSFDADPTVSAAALERAPSANGAAHLSANGKAAGGCAPQLGCTPVVIKVEGKIDNLMKLAYAEVAARGINLEQQLDNHAGIAHTRWATHGVPSAVNSHPQVSDPAHGFVVVHNGIITNFKALKDFLVRSWVAGCTPDGSCNYTGGMLRLSILISSCSRVNCKPSAYFQTYMQILPSVPTTFNYVRPAQIKQGAKFVSDTDTEVIPKLCEYIYRNLQEPLPLNEVR